MMQKLRLAFAPAHALSSTRVLSPPGSSAMITSKRFLESLYGQKESAPVEQKKETATVAQARGFFGRMR